ncbi:nucleotide sugar dehydrogenase [Gammaproteobacteria bacterium]|nr:nucleotide sugar dehydrogenase [Gammaproteobacteria bacterium]
MHKHTIAIVGLGYVGLPLALEFGKKYKTIGFDLHEEKIAGYKNHIDPTGEISSAQLKSVDGIIFTSDPELLNTADFIIVAVPTPVDDGKIPDFRPLENASITVGKNMKKGVTVVFESTVYPGATEEICIPLLERESGMIWKNDFNVGYSPERVNPGDTVQTLTKIIKVVAGDNLVTQKKLTELYGEIIEAGIHTASSIKVAEASKVIENTQRDLNIALINELAIIFNKLGIDTTEVLEAAGTKWNFLPFRPGLVGGHCIGVDPYYLTYKAESLGYHPEVILAGRRINDSMGAYIAEMTLQNMVIQGGYNKGDNVIILGLTFKEDCSDLRNSKVVDLISRLKKYGLNVAVHDPIADSNHSIKEYGIKLTDWDSLPKDANAIIAAVSHKEYLEMPIDDILSFLKPKSVFTDVKSAFDEDSIRKAGHSVWRL